MLVGLATASLGDKGKPIDIMLRAGTEVCMKIVSYIMYYAPIGFFAYFAILTAQLGHELLATYVRATLLYYFAALLYFGLAFTLYAYLSNQKNGMRIFWKNAALPSMTALATCSSAVSIPANLQATSNIGVPEEIRDIVVPVGAILHKDGSVLGGMLKIAFLFGLFQIPFTGITVILLALLLAMLIGTVIGAIPSGGMIAEMLIISLYGFPPEALIIITAISILIDPLATMLNVVSNTVCSMLVARLLIGKQWIKLKV
jgi:Na+/H+-dicarboxylate symporter